MDNIYNPRYENLLGDYGLIHPSVRFGENVRIGEGVIIEEGCQIGDNVMIGHYSVLRPNTIVGNDTKISHYFSCEEGAEIGSHCNLGIYSHLTKDVVMEDWVFYGAGAMTLNAKKILYGREGTTTLEAPYICRGARIGGRVLIMPGIRIGKEAMIGAGSLVTKDVPELECWMGSPAKFISKVPADEWLAERTG